MRSVRSLLPLVAAAVVACSQGGPATPDAAALLRQSASAMASVHSLKANVTFGPGVVYEGFTLASAQTAVALPASSDTTLKVRQQDFLVDLRVVDVDGSVYVKAPFAAWEQISAQEAAQLPDLAALFDARSGLPALLAQGRSPRYLGTEKVAGTDCDKVGATYTADQVATLVRGLKPAGDVDATLWMGRSDHRLYRVLLSGPLVAAGQKTTVDIAISGYDAPMAIARPTP